MTDFLEYSDVITLLRTEIAQTGSQAAWCRKTGINRTILNKVLHGRKPPTKKMIVALDLRMVFIPRNKSPQSK
jgi:DNA-binding phage protein